MPAAAPLLQPRYATFAEAFDWPNCPKERRPTCYLCGRPGQVCGDRDRYGFANTWRYCNVCGLCWAEYLPTSEALREFYAPGPDGEPSPYRRLTTAWDPSEPTPPAQAAQWWFNRFRDTWTLAPTDRLLDWGGDDGAIGDALADGYHLTTPPDLVDPANPAGSMDPAPGAYDAVICHQTIDHLAEPLDDLRDIRRALRPGGQFLITFVDHQQVAQLHKGAAGAFKIDHPYNYSDTSARKLLNRAGFSILKAQRYAPRFLAYLCTP